MERVKKSKSKTNDRCLRSRKYRRKREVSSSTSHNRRRGTCTWKISACMSCEKCVSTCTLFAQNASSPLCLRYMKTVRISANSACASWTKHATPMNSQSWNFSPSNRLHFSNISLSNSRQAYSSKVMRNQSQSTDLSQSSLESSLLRIAYGRLVDKKNIIWMKVSNSIHTRN